MGVHDGHRERMRKRFLAEGLENFADHEALEMLLYYVFRQQDTNPVAHRLIQRYGSLSGALSAPIKDLKRVEGVGEQTAVFLNLVFQLAHRVRLDESWPDAPLDRVERVGPYLLELFEGAREEKLFQLCLDGKKRLTDCRMLSTGSTGSTDLNIRRMVENALQSCASFVILAHNHPSGIALPSEDDYVTTRRAWAALEPVGVRLLDHVIVADRDFVSMADSGYLEDF